MQNKYQVRKMKRIIVMAVATFMVTGLFAQKRVPATPNPIETVQPNGDSLTVRLYGDEHFHYYATVDGYKIVKNKKGCFCYAKLDKENNLTASSRKAKNEEKRTKCETKYLQTKGLKR